MLWRFWWRIHDHSLGRIPVPYKQMIRTKALISTNISKSPSKHIWFLYTLKENKLTTYSKVPVSKYNPCPLFTVGYADASVVT